MRELWFESGGARLFAVETGAGETIVMLHGGMASHLASLPLVLPLAPRHRVVAPDLRGSGRSWSGAPLTFDRLADDVEALLDHLGADRTVVGGVSSGSGVAVRFALRHPRRTAALVVVRPVYGGEERGYTDEQKRTFARMDAVASRAPAEGVQILGPLYAGLPGAIREKALAMVQGFDAASVAATSRFLASGAQPFASADELRSVSVPALLVRGDDALHPAEVSDVYAEILPCCTVMPASTTDVAAGIDAFLELLQRSGASGAVRSGVPAAAALATRPVPSPGRAASPTGGARRPCARRPRTPGLRTRSPAGRRPGRPRG